MRYLNQIQISYWKKVVYLAIFLAFTSSLCVAQRSDSLNRGVRISSFGFSLGAVILTEEITKQTDVWIKDFNSIAPNNPYLNKDLDTNGQDFSRGQAGFNINCFLNLKSNKAKSNFAKRTEHRIGLYYTVKPKYQLGLFKADS
ncbi:MAG: hypothetical protein V4677_13455, partial [Bacteroidota bacterium]